MKLIDLLADFLAVEYDTIESYVEIVTKKLQATMRALFTLLMKMPNNAVHLSPPP